MAVIKVLVAVVQCRIDVTELVTVVAVRQVAMVTTLGGDVICGEEVTEAAVSGGWSPVVTVTLSVLPGARAGVTFVNQQTLIKLVQSLEPLLTFSWRI